MIRFIIINQGKSGSLKQVKLQYMNIVVQAVVQKEELTITSSNVLENNYAIKKNFHTQLGIVQKNSSLMNPKYSTCFFVNNTGISLVGNLLFLKMK